ncbi:IclR family transcriptional regulator [Brevibacterium sp. R8603A2]|uniref:IclR family transcriptional regulator n=1 Tax=Brevibacterium sp. R8603A2 TaxID=2929779 RepID=UPI001FF7CBD7|nr:IclR family transcriptional regulator [Brevibacterium sp. R8603A2]MCK1801963.1 IclR family transcriptional regulator [Brevibacterium sp. R8603A2]
MSSPQRVQSVDRTLDVLEALADAGGAARSKDLATAIRLPVPTVHRILGTLAARGIVLQLADRSYSLGPRLVRLGAVAAHQTGAEAQPLLAALAESLGETVNLAFFTRDSMTYVAQAASPRSMRMFTEVGRRVPLHNTGVGKAVLAALPVEEARGLLALPPVDSGPAPDVEALLGEIARAREVGYAVDDEEQEVGVRCLAVAVPGGPAPAGLSVSGPSSRLTPQTFAEVARALSATAAGLAERWHAYDRG